jgi:V-type H+-transporting ATPase subunit E
MEPSVTVHARPQDIEVVKQAALTAARKYKDISGRDIKVEVEGSLSKGWSAFSFLSVCAIPDLGVNEFYSAGGIKLVDGSRRITVDNTLDERLRLLEEKVTGFNFHPVQITYQIT